MTTLVGNSAAGTVQFVESTCASIAGFRINNLSGRGISVVSGSPLIYNCLIDNNTAATYGGGVYVLDGDPRIVSNIIVGNFAGTVGNIGRGGGIGLFGSSALIANNLIHGNQAHSNVTGGRGGGIACQNGSTPTIVNNTITANHATRSSSSSSYGGGGVYADGGSTPLVRNTILWGNLKQGSLNQIQVDGSVSVTHCAVQLGWAGTGNIDIDPLITAPGGFRLGHSSPCIDSGDNSAVPHGIDVDIIGRLRFHDTLETPDTGNGISPIVDMGAWEHFSKLARRKF